MDGFSIESDTWLYAAVYIYLDLIFRSESHKSYEEKILHVNNNFGNPIEKSRNDRGLVCILLSKDSEGRERSEWSKSLMQKDLTPDMVKGNACYTKIWVFHGTKGWRIV